MAVTNPNFSFRRSELTPFVVDDTELNKFIAKQLDDIKADLDAYIGGKTPAEKAKRRDALPGKIITKIRKAMNDPTSGNLIVVEIIADGKDVSARRDQDPSDV